MVPPTKARSVEKFSFSQSQPPHLFLVRVPPHHSLSFLSVSFFPLISSSSHSLHISERLPNSELSLSSHSNHNRQATYSHYHAQERNTAIGEISSCTSCKTGRCRCRCRCCKLLPRRIQSLIQTEKG